MVVIGPLSRNHTGVSCLPENHLHEVLPTARHQKLQTNSGTLFAHTPYLTSSLLENESM